MKVIKLGKVGNNYNIGARNVMKNIDLVKKICLILEKIYPYTQNNANNKIKKKSYLELIKYVKDRPGHDLHYAINPRKIEDNLNWKSSFNLNQGLYKTVEWYVSFYNKKI